MTVATELADLVWQNPGTGEQFFTLYPSESALPLRCPSGLADEFDGFDGPARHVLTYEEAIASWATGGMRYFGVVPRKEPTTEARLEVIEHYWCLWVDLDDPQGLETVERELRPLDFWPSAIVNTGSRGHHLYFRLDTTLPLPLIELYNRALSRLVGGDPGTPQMPNNHLRVPGTIHEKSGGTAQVIEMSGAAYGRNALRRLNAGLVPALEPMMDKLQRRRRAAERKLEAAEEKLAAIERREQRAIERRLTLKSRQERLSQTRAELNRTRDRLAETREELNRSARELDAQRKAREARRNNRRRPLTAQRLRRGLARVARTARN